MREFLVSIQGTNLAIWGIIWLGLACVVKMSDPEKVVLALGGGLIGYISGYYAGKARMLSTQLDNPPPAAEQQKTTE